MMHEWVYWQIIGFASDENVGCDHRWDWLIKKGWKTESLEEKNSKN